ncbi:inter-alpha-trypsin inhibitor heavy chain H5-like isoform X2 [Homalodisca vitripennis]|uniref:inter-alpha-trypsin inhibitor heavy chain H5-like isoform X2 n=1 Tax=Homalodisca vitripennis TaxID=197043 RepID=UPI001EEAE82D|nr:inter-alpha-trypsin inhibitor heavy chain H5-like isoform X2 [Homalodisca vitripennis]
MLLLILVSMWLAGVVGLGYHGIAEAFEDPKINSLNVITYIKNRFATTLVSCRYDNPSSLPGEATFVVTLPDKAFISNFVIEETEKVYKSQVVRRHKQARARTSGHPGALDARNSNRFEVSVEIEPHGTVTFKLTYEQLLTRNLGVFTNTVNVSPHQIVDDLSVTVNIEEPTAITHLQVTELHIPETGVPKNENSRKLAKIKDLSECKKEVIWAPTSEQQREYGPHGFRGQLVLKYEVYREQTATQLLSVDDYFSIHFAPENLVELKKHIVFVLDFSSSMAKRKMGQLKVAMRTILSDLKPKDYFSIVIFHTHVKVWTPKGGLHLSGQMNGMNECSRLGCVIEASPDNITLARNFIHSHSETGNTNIIGGLKTGLQLVHLSFNMQKRDEINPPQPIMVFLTDGKPGVEETNPDKIVKTIISLNAHKCSIYSLGFGKDADMRFLRKLSLSNDGFAKPIYEAEDASAQLNDFYQSVAKPLLSDVKFNFSSDVVDMSNNTKTAFPMFAKGSEIEVCGKLKINNINKLDVIGNVTGNGNAGVVKYPIIYNAEGKTQLCRSFKEEPEGLVEKIWAHKTIHQLLDEAESHDGKEKTQALEEATKIAEKYSLVTPVTSAYVMKPNQEHVIVDAVPVKAGDWSYSDSNGNIVGQPSLSVNNPYGDINSERATKSYEFNFDCTFIYSAVAFVITTILVSVHDNNWLEL